MEEQKREAKTLNLVLLLMGLGTFLVAVWTVMSDQFRAGTDDLFLVVVCLLLTAVFVALPAKWAHDMGLFSAGDDDEPAETTALAADHGHGASTRLFVYVWIALLAITFFEVFLAYIQIRKDVMLIMLMGGSIVKAALIMAYFMHLRFERLSLVLTLVPAMVICLTLLCIFFPDSFRLHTLRELLR
jgi:cytochrome c oxidase subunit 4